MAIHIEDNFMALEVDGATVASVQSSKRAAGDGSDAWIITTHPSVVQPQAGHYGSDARRALHRWLAARTRCREELFS